MAQHTGAAGYTNSEGMLRAFTLAMEGSMRATLMLYVVTLAAAGCGPSRLAGSARFTGVPTYASTSGAAQGGGPTVACGPDLPAGTRLQARVDTPINTTHAVPGQPFYSTVMQPIEGAAGGVIVPAGSRVIG
jgi:hypothetical protein